MKMMLSTISVLAILTLITVVNAFASVTLFSDDGKRDAEYRMEYYEFDADEELFVQIPTDTAILTLMDYR